MNGLTKEQQTRLSLISCLNEGQSQLILSGVLAILDSKLQYDVYAGYTQKMLAEELIDDIDKMISKAYEKGLYN